MKTILAVIVVLAATGQADAKSARYWTRLASRAKTELAQKMYLDEATRVAASRKHIVAKASKKAEGRADRIKARANAKTPPSVGTLLSMMAIKAWASKPRLTARRTWVRSYHRTDGTYVRGHYRSR